VTNCDRIVINGLGRLVQDLRIYLPLLDRPLNVALHPARHLQIILRGQFLAENLVVEDRLGGPDPDDFYVPDDELSFSGSSEILFQHPPGLVCLDLEGFYLLIRAREITGGRF
jgi:hypothetical protein